MFYVIARFFTKLYFSLLFRIEVKGAEHLPKEGGVIICSNHISNYDPVMVGNYFNRTLHFMAKRELFQNGFVTFFLKQLKAFPVDREKMDMQAFKTAIQILKQGGALGIFAQGTRSKDGKEADAKAGVALFALKGNAAVVPTCILGNYKPFSRMTILYGSPMHFDAYQGKKIKTEELAALTEKIMDEIKKLRQQEEQKWK